MMYLLSVCDPEYAAMMNVQPKPKGRGKKKVV
jgi:hypothetical protein